MDDVDDDVQKLAQSLGLSESELRLNLGVAAPAPAPAPDAGAAALNALAEMFAHVPRSDVRAALAENDGDSARAAEQLLSWEALRPEVAAADEIGRRKLHKAARAERKQAQRRQRSSEDEKKNVAALADILGVPLPDAQSLYATHGSVTDAVLASTAPRTAAPATQQETVAALESRNEYSGLSVRELRAHLGRVDARLGAMRERAHKYGASRLTRALSADTHRELRELVAERRDIELALGRETFFRSAVHSQHCVDLHGLTLETAKSVCRDIVRDFKGSADATTMEIVTGAGRHSAAGRSVIKEWLRGYLRAENVRAEELEGSFVLRKKRIV